ncbi:MAG: M23 family metallopeptidase [Bacilli bacterium]|nr:M23 family metallopeptidase [Bacilli bacterium]
MSYNNKFMKKKIIKIILGSSTGLIIVSLIIIVSILMVYSFFGGEIFDSGYVEGNMEYAEVYRSVLNNNITRNINGYIPLSRLMYFYLEDDNLSLNEIYENNIDYELKTIKPFKEVCLEHYNSFYTCQETEILKNNHSDEYPFKPFNAPVKFEDTIITSYYGEERIVYDRFNIHYAWDFAAPAETPVYSIGDGIVKKVMFSQSTNKIDINNGFGNYIRIEYNVDDRIYEVIYAHLYPYSSKVQVGEIVKSWQEIATIGTTGYSTGNHLHWEVILENIKIDGLNLVDFNL